MKKLLGALALSVAVVTVLWSQPALRIVTHPRIPPRDVLDRLNLTVAWAAKLPVGGQRDGLFTVQFVPDKKQTQLIVQTVFGAVHALDAETGDFLWRTNVGIAGSSAKPVGYNERYLFVTRRDMLHVLSRATGEERYYTLDKDTKLPDYGFLLPSPPSAAPVADEFQLYLCMGNRIDAFLLPDWDAKGVIKTADGRELTPDERKAFLERASALPPILNWTHSVPFMRLEQPVLDAPAFVSTFSTAGEVITFNKIERQPPLEFKTAGGVSAPVGQHGVMAYIGSDDSVLYAFNVATQRLAWRFFASAPILVKPETTDRDVFVSAQRVGLHRVDRVTGQGIWLNKQADRFLSTDRKYVYALDQTGLLLVLDYARGTTLGQYDMRDWVIPVPNELNDRIYLANHDGQILCLHNRADRVPVKTKTIESLIPIASPKQKEEKKGDAADMEKEKDAEKEKEAKEKEPEKAQEKEKGKDEPKDKEGSLLNRTGPRAVSVGVLPSSDAHWQRRARMAS